MAAMIVFGDYTPPNPYKYKVTQMDLDGENTTRSETGVLTRDRIRAGIYQIDLAFKIDKAEIVSFASAISGESIGVTFFDPTSATTQTATMYPGNKSAELMSYKDGSEDDSYWDYSFTLTEF